MEGFQLQPDLNEQVTILLKMKTKSLKIQEKLIVITMNKMVIKSKFVFIMRLKIKFWI